MGTSMAGGTGVPGPTAAAAWLPVAVGTAVTRGLALCAFPPPLARFSGAAGSAAAAGGPELRALPLLLHLYHLFSVFQSILL